MAIAISAGTTTHAMGARVAEIPGVTVVTNAIGLAEVLHRIGRRDQTVILTGGTRTPSEALVGPFAVAQLRSIHVDLVFMGVHGMDAKAGFSCPNLLEAETDIALIEAGRRLVVLADHTKWGVVGIASIARLDQADILVTDPHLTPDAATVLTEHVGRIIVADPDGDATDLVAPVAGARGPGRARRVPGGRPWRLPRPSPPAGRTDGRCGPTTRRSKPSRGSPIGGSTP